MEWAWSDEGCMKLVTAPADLFDGYGNDTLVDTNQRYCRGSVVCVSGTEADLPQTEDWPIRSSNQWTHSDPSTRSIPPEASARTRPESRAWPRGLENLGIDVDRHLNRSVDPSGGPVSIHAKGSRTAVLVIATNEELEIARQVQQAVQTG